MKSQSGPTLLDAQLLQEQIRRAYDTYRKYQVGGVTISFLKHMER